MQLPPPHQPPGPTETQMTITLAAGILCYVVLWFADWQLAALLSAFILALAMAAAGTARRD